MSHPKNRHLERLGETGRSSPMVKVAQLVMFVALEDVDFTILVVNVTGKSS